MVFTRRQNRPPRDGIDGRGPRRLCLRAAAPQRHGGQGRPRGAQAGLTVHCPLFSNRSVLRQFFFTHAVSQLFSHLHLPDIESSSYFIGRPMHFSVFVYNYFVLIFQLFLTFYSHTVSSQFHKLFHVHYQQQYHSVLCLCFYE